MVRLAGCAVLALLLPLLPSRTPATPPRLADGPAYTAEGSLRFPENYREWVFLSSGLDMSYDPKPQPSGSHTFNNVFVNPAAYRAYQGTGHWPDGTMLVLENRPGQSGTRASRTLNKAGQTQTDQVSGVEVHVLDATHAAAPASPSSKPDGWTFYSFENQISAKPIARPASCYTCHEEHAAVDTTFVQFYPTLVPAATRHKTFSAAYLADIK